MIVRGADAIGVEQVGNLACTVTVAYIERLIRVLDARIRGKKSAGQATDDEDGLVFELKKILEAKA